jgi:hypothetical protein
MPISENQQAGLNVVKRHSTSVGEYSIAAGLKDEFSGAGSVKNYAFARTEIGELPLVHTRDNLKFDFAIVKERPKSEVCLERL